MTRFGYTLMTEQSGPKELVRYAVAAEKAGFDFEVSSDHFSPWLAAQGHSPYAWSVLGAVAQGTERVELATYVTCPTIRYHPAVVAQKAATMQLLSDGRFILGLGAGENLNEHVIGEGWPAVGVRQDMLEEAVHIIRSLFDGHPVTWAGDYFRVDSAKLWDVPANGVPIGIAVSGPKSIERFAPLSDHFISTVPDKSLLEGWRAARAGGAAGSGPGGAATDSPEPRFIGQIPICWGTDTEAAIAKAHEQFRWFGGGWSVNADLPTPDGFDGASQFVRPEDVAGSIACGPDLDALAESARAFIDAGYTDVALVQVGDEGQDEFLAEAAGPLLEKLRALA
jgi:G6PDH family F420-dependent oxidoreductase